MERVFTDFGEVRKIHDLPWFAGYGVEHRCGCYSSPYGVTFDIHDYYPTRLSLRAAYINRGGFLLRRTETYLIQTNKTVLTARPMASNL